MRELVLKNLMSTDHKKKEVFLSESHEKSGYVQKMEKHSVYIIEDVITVAGDFDVNAYLEEKKQEGMLQPKQTCIVKVHDTKKCEDKFTYKIWGDLYAIVDDKLYLIRLKQILKMEFVQAKTKAG